MVSRTRSHGHRLLGLLLACGVLVTLLQPTGVSAALLRSPSSTQAAVPGRGPAKVAIPPTSMPLHGFTSAKQVLIDPPSLKADDLARASVAPRAIRSGADGGASDPAPAATNLHLVPGLVVGDTSLLLYFDAPDTGWTQATVALYADSDHGTVLHTATLQFAQAAVCRAPAKFCFTLDNADGWGLADGTAYAATITLTASDGSSTVSGFSPAGTARALPVPPPVDPAQVGSIQGAGSNGPTDSQPMIRGVGVNTAIGAFTQHAVDAAMSSSYAIDVQAERSYSSLDTTQGVMGVGWSFSYQARVFPKPGAMGAQVFKAEDGTETTYTLQADGSYSAPGGALSRLAAASGGGWTVKTPAKQTLTFDASGRLLSKLDERGKGVTLGYDGSGNLATVTDAGGRALSVTITGGLLTALGLPDGRRVEYTYSANRLATVRDPDGGVTSFGYDGSGRLATITDALGHLQLTTLYDQATGRVSEQLDHFNKATTFTWDPTKQRSVVTDPDGAIFTDGYLGNVLQFSQNGNGDVSQFRADSSLNLRVLQDPDGSQYVMTHDAEGNVTSRTLVDAGPSPQAASEGSTYDADNNLTAFTDANGHTTHYTYNQFGQLTTMTDPLGNTSNFDYDPGTGLLVEVTDPLGNMTRFAYDAAGNKVSETNPLGALTRFAYDATGRLTSGTDARGTAAGADPAAFTSASAYDGEDRLLKSVDALGRSQTWSYDSAGRLRSHADGDGFVANYAYNDGSQLVTRADADQRTTTYTYTPGGRTASVKDGVGDTTTYTYNSAGEVRTVTSPRGNVQGADAAPFTTTYFYDFKGNVTLEQHPDPNGGTDTIQYAYDSLNHLVAVTDPLGRTTTTTYDAAGNRIATQDPLKNTRRWQYDADNRVNQATDPLGNSLTNTYDAAGRVLTQTTALGETTSFAYDAAGHLVAQTSPRGNSTRFVYDAAGNQVSVTDPLGDTETAIYDADNNVVKRTDPNGHSTTYKYDGDNRLITIAGPDATRADQLTINGYDHAGHLISRTDPLGNVTRYTYDAAGRLTSTTDALSRTRQYAYDADGNMTALVTARATQSDDAAIRAANTITQKYDSRDRLTERDLGAGGAVYTFGYDADSEKTSLANAAGQEARVYDDDGRLIKDSTGPATFAYSYDAAGNLTGRTLPDGRSQTLTYDRDNQPSSLTGPVGAAVYTYDADGNLTNTALPGGSSQQRTYDRADRLATLADLAPGGQPLSSYTVTRDAVGNPVRLDTTQAGSTRSDAFTYDAANRLTAMCFQVDACPDDVGKKSEAVTFTYDLVGNRLTRTAPDIGPGQGGHTEKYRYDAANELTKVTGDPGHPVFYTYDADGNQVEARAEGRDKSDVKSTFDLDNQLLSVDDGVQRTVYTQDAAGNRAAGDTAPDAGGAASHTSYQWDVNTPLPMLASEQSGGGPARSYTYSPGGSPLSLEVGGAAFLYQPDPFGNIAELTDLAGGVQQQFTMTDPFGGFAQTSPGGPTAPAARLSFQGQYNDPLSGAYHLRARDYVTDTGQFHSPDPVSQPASRPAQSSYVYANDNPLTGSDPSGLGCGWFSVVCDAATKVVSTVSSAVSTAADAVASAASTVAQDVSSAVEDGINLVKQAAADVQRAASQVVNTATSVVRTVVHAASDAYHAAATWVDKHKAQIASIAAAIAVGAACEALTAGAGTIGCAALAGAAGSMVQYGLSTPSSQLSLGGFLKAGIIGGVTGALGGAGGVLLGKLGGAVLDDVAGGIMSRIGSGAAEDVGADAVATAGGEAVGSTAGKLASEETAAETVQTAAISDTVSEGSGAGLTCPASFAAGTAVLMADGSRKPIERVQVGDQVEAKDPVTGELRTERVDATFDHKNREGWVAIHIGGDVIQVTDEHPFWVASLHRFVPAGQLKRGDELELPNGAGVRVESVASFATLRDHYNLTVHELHTYFAGSPGVLVHNCGEGFIDPATVRFSQSSVSPSFSSGGSIENLAAGLRSGDIPPGEVPPIRLVERDGNLFTLDNRRLVAFQQAGVSVPYRMATAAEENAEKWKFTTTNAGTSIRIRGGGGVWRP